MPEPDPFGLIAGRDFDCLASTIQCRADRHGARVFTVKHPHKNTYLRVLGHSEADAKSAAASHQAQEEEEPSFF